MCSTIWIKDLGLGTLMKFTWWKFTQWCNNSLGGAKSHLVISKSRDEFRLHQQRQTCSITDQDANTDVPALKRLYIFMPKIEEYYLTRMNYSSWTLCTKFWSVTFRHVNRQIYRTSHKTAVMDYAKHESSARIFVKNIFYDQ